MRLAAQSLVLSRHARRASPSTALVARWAGSQGLRGSSPCPGLLPATGEPVIIRVVSAFSGLRGLLLTMLLVSSSIKWGSGDNPPWRIREEPSTEACKCTLPKETTLGILDAGSSLWLVIGCHGPCRLSLIIDILKFLNPLQAIFAHTRRFIQC